MRNKKTWITIGVVVALLCLCAGVFAALENLGFIDPLPTNTEAAVVIPTETAVVLPTATEDLCQLANPRQADYVVSGIASLQESNSVGNVYAVKSKDFESVYFVAAMIYGPGIGDEGAGPGVWAISGTPDSPGLILSVNGFADQFTNYPMASTTEFDVSMLNDGAQFVSDCASSH